MLLSLDFGITITDILRKNNNGELFHQMLPSKEKPSEGFILEIFKDLDFKEVNYLALTGGHHQLIGKFIKEIIPYIKIIRENTIITLSFFNAKFVIFMMLSQFHYHIFKYLTHTSF